MEKVTVLTSDKLFNSWIDPSFLPKDTDKYYIRDTQVKKPEGGWRHLTSDEIEQLVKNDNTALSWDTIWVTDEFLPHMLKGNNFFGTVRLGRISDKGLQFHDLRLPIGITNSSIHSCDIGNDCAIHDVHYLSHYIIGDRCMLFNIHEMSTTDHAKFGNGVVKDGEDPSVRVDLQIMNETGCRAVYPFENMITADAYLWAKYRDDAKLMKNLSEMTQNVVDHHRGYYGTVGEGCVIKTSGIIKDAKIGDGCYIKGASKLKNITIKSNDKEPVQIGENVILVNGIVGYGCRIFYGCTAVKFVIGSHCNLKYGARVIDSILGDNSTISCCEVLNNLIFPAHEQHHNNSFLIASCVKGQSNLAAGATIGSNHNSRANDNEVVAGRGFWPGLCTSVKHSSVFASFTLISKGAYPSELNVQLPFSLLTNNESAGELEIYPAFWWTHNMYALARNSWKFQTRDKRIIKIQNIELDTYAPDSMEEAITGMRLLEKWTAKAWYRQENEDVSAISEEQLTRKGAELLGASPEEICKLQVFGEGIEKSKRRVRICKPYEAYHAYGDMLIHYAMMNVLNYVDNHQGTTLGALSSLLDGKRHREWVNMGGQLMKDTDLDSLREDIGKGVLTDWEAIHRRYNEIWEHYPIDKLKHAYLSMCLVLGVDSMSSADWKKTIEKEKTIQNYICDQVYESRGKDYLNPFRCATYRNKSEMEAAIGPLENNDFVKMICKQTACDIKRLETLII